MQRIIQIIIIAYFQSSLYLLRKNFFHTFSIGYNAILSNKVKNKKYNTVGTIPKSNIKIVESGKIGNSNTQIHDWLLTFLAWYRYFNKMWDCQTSFISSNLPSYALSEIMWSCKCLLCMSKMPILTYNGRTASL